ncbi:C40 family peptidase [Flexithrix dorotheae]|uniref:C40 family peptidase n=1 Tax=Flexithrix dorotheae TaxID=70993 RepID=UPI00037A1386|nr:C40 family peptidase [Flexithrix dorotheae]
MKVSAIAISLFFSICAFQYSKPGFFIENDREDVESIRDNKADSIVNLAQNFLGITYKYGGTSPKDGFDCSGFVYYVMKNNEIDVPRTSSGYQNFGKNIAIEEAERGDIILFKGTDPTVDKIGHVGIVISQKGEPLRFIHSSSSKKHYGIVIAEYSESNYPKRFKGIRRVF